jgi:predicted transcriptional regulator
LWLSTSDTVADGPRSANLSDQIELQKIIGQIAAAYFNNSHVNPSEIPIVINNIAASLAAVGAAPAPEAAPEEPEAPKLTPAQIRRSIAHDKLISFEDGKGYKTLRRHLAVKGLTPTDYRNKWGLPADYPMVAPSYSEARSNLAKARGFGSRPAVIARATTAAASAPAAPAVARAEAKRATPAKRAAKGGGKGAATRRAARTKTRSSSEPTA